MHEAEPEKRFDEGRRPRAVETSPQLTWIVGSQHRGPVRGLAGDPACFAPPRAERQSA